MSAVTFAPADRSCALLGLAYAFLTRAMSGGGRTDGS